VKALSLWQPWASAVACGSKRIETRSWSTKHRGPLAIHAAKRCVKQELIFYRCHPYWQGAVGWMWTNAPRAWQGLEFGVIIGVVDLIDCRPTESFTVAELDTERQLGNSSRRRWTERQLGDFSPGRYGWVLANARELPEPIPCRGHQRLFNVELAELEPLFVGMEEARVNE